ncbi:radical SAM family heme chaperone HemW [Larsenimonas salina]|uniref:radical SAM family heme chaperone HemW n=1 Tax=Larsenimonas salina TaxID=1295565 RepID=UPI00207413E2|nr:radical SAM family heme chaperone HemW [Larsenimonas salina]MCM5704686.1 radical SAM family heme chaperone HemW [Larsenimonas salina]
MILPSISLYIHVPWCIRKCPYCDFNSHEVGAHGVNNETDYVEALIADFKRDAELLNGRRINSIFIGGGTPSLFSDAAYGRLLEAVSSMATLEAGAEITLEANPGTTERRYLAGYRHAGINRLSLGVQSFNEQALSALGRIHGRGEALSAVDDARRAGFDNLNLDLMHGLPQQSVEQALEDLDTAIGLFPEHLSWYQLTFEPNTAFYSQPPELPDEDSLIDIQELGHQHLEQAGFKRYEISAYAKSDALRSRHNLNYWRFGDYLGIGAGAHGKVSRAQDQTLLIERYWKTRQPEAYLRRRNDPRGFLAGSRMLETEEIPTEFLMNALRLVDGVPSSLWYEHTGLSHDTLRAHLSQARMRGLINDNDAVIQANEKGLLFLNDVLELCDSTPT